SKKLTFLSSGNTNVGAFDLLGGTLELPDLTNSGRITGQGNLLVAGGINNNLGTMLFSGGNSTIEGNVTNTNGKLLVTGGSQTTFRNDVTNTGIAADLNVGSSS